MSRRTGTRVSTESDGRRSKDRELTNNENNHQEHEPPKTTSPASPPAPADAMSPVAPKPPRASSSTEREQQKGVSLAVGLPESSPPRMRRSGAAAKAEKKVTSQPFPSIAGQRKRAKGRLWFAFASIESKTTLPRSRRHRRRRRE